MTNPARFLRKLLDAAMAGLFLAIIAAPAQSQDLDPRAYARVPVGMPFVVGGFSYSHGGIVTDATSVIQNGEADVETASLAVGYTFGLFGQTAQVFAALPYSWARLSGDAAGGSNTITRSGMADARIRLAALLLGAPATELEGFADVPRQTILGASILVSAPTGQNFPDKVINLSANRWAFKPEVAVSHPLGERWLVDLYAGLWLFTANDEYYPGTSSRTQDPLASFQGHVSYNLTPRMWLALDMTYYAGGLSFVDGAAMDDRQNNSRIGGTLVLPVGTRHSVKFSGSTGAIIRFGADFTTVSVGWQSSFF